MPAPGAHLRSWLGFGLLALGRIGLATWAGATLGWTALALRWPSGGWAVALALSLAVVVVLPSLGVLVAGRFLLRRSAWETPPVARRLALGLAVACFLAAGVLAFVDGWPR